MPTPTGNPDVGDSGLSDRRIDNPGLDSPGLDNAGLDNAGLDPKRELLRHALATLAYRGGKAVRQAPPGFAEFRAGEGVRAPGEILAHIGDLFDWALSIAMGQQRWHDSPPLPWDKEVHRFFSTLKGFDDFLASTEAVRAPLEKLLQGPIADALTHVGQISILRRLAGTPVKPENYYRAEIKSGRVGADQAETKGGF
jgi:hypothetical protein